MSNYWTPKSEQLNKLTIGNVTITLASWQPEPFFHPSYEIGWRCGGEFYLIQFRMPKDKAWDIVKRLVIKGKHPNKIIQIMDRLDW